MWTCSRLTDSWKQSVVAAVCVCVCGHVQLEAECSFCSCDLFFQAHLAGPVYQEHVFLPPTPDFHTSHVLLIFTLNLIEVNLIRGDSNTLKVVFVLGIPPYLFDL